MSEEGEIIYGHKPSDNRKEIEAKVREFLSKVAELSDEYQLTISHQDGMGAFVIEEYSIENLEWLYAAARAIDDDYWYSDDAP